MRICMRRIVQWCVGALGLRMIIYSGDKVDGL